jgi:hypothetical protein
VNTEVRFRPPVLAFAVGATCGAVSYKFESISARIVSRAVSARRI